jgi:hypothetical protein
MHLRSVCSCTLGILLLLAPGWTWADNTACAGAMPIIPDGSDFSGALTAVGQARWFFANLHADRSYAIMLENENAGDYASLVCTYGRLLTSCSGSAPTYTVISSAEPAAYLSAGRLALKAPSNTNFYFSVDQCGGSTPTNFRVRVEDTTLVSPLFSTFGGFNTYYRFSNTTSQAVRVTLKLVADDGSVVADSTFLIAAGATAPTRHTGASDLNVAASTAGQAIITHDGPPGAIHADGFLRAVSGSGSAIVLPVKIERAHTLH